MIMARNEDGTYSQVGFVKDNAGIDTEYIYDKDGDIVFEKGFIRETSSTIPLTISGIGKDLKKYSITGNTVQNGTPTPDTPQEVKAVGDRTANLFDYKKYFESTFTKTNEYFEFAEIQLKPFTTYTFNTSYPHNVRQDKVIETSFIIATSTEVPATVNGGISSTLTATKTTEADGIIKIYKRIYSLYFPNFPKKEDFDSGMHWLMINEGDTALPYEPYGYKIPVVTRGKNLFDNISFFKRSNVTAANNSGKVSIASNISYDETVYSIDNLDIGKNYIFSFDTDANITNGNIRITKDKTSTSFNNSLTNIRVKKAGSYYAKFTPTNSAFYLVLIVNNSEVIDTQTVTFSNLQIEVGTVGTEYEPYQEPITTPIYLSEPLQAGEVLRSDGSRDVKWGKITFDGSDDEEWNEYLRGYRIFVANAKSVSNGVKTTALCSHFVAKKYLESLQDGIISFSQRGSTDGTTNGFAFSLGEETGSTNVENWRKRLSESPVTVVYPLAESTTETFTAPQIPTLNGTTIIDVDTAVKPTEMYTKYKSSK